MIVCVWRALYSLLYLWALEHTHKNRVQKHMNMVSLCMWITCDSSKYIGDFCCWWVSIYYK